MVQFESLVDLITYYEKNPLYRKVCLKLPLSEDLLSRQQSSSSRNGSTSDDTYVTDPGNKDPGWWKGDYGGRKQHWFPANFVQEIEPANEVHEITNAEDNNAAQENLMPLGDMQK